MKSFEYFILPFIVLLGGAMLFISSKQEHRKAEISTAIAAEEISIYRSLLIQAGRNPSTNPALIVTAIHDQPVELGKSLFISPDGTTLTILNRDLALIAWNSGVQKFLPIKGKSLAELKRDHELDVLPATLGIRLMELNKLHSAYTSFQSASK